MPGREGVVHSGKGGGVLEVPMLTLRGRMERGLWDCSGLEMAHEEQCSFISEVKLP